MAGIITASRQRKRIERQTGNACFVSAGFIRCLNFHCHDRNSISKVFGLHDDILEYISSSPIGICLLIAPEHVIPFEIKQLIEVEK